MIEMTEDERTRLAALRDQFEREKFIAGRELAEYALLFVAEKDQDEATLVLYRLLPADHETSCMCKGCLPL